MSASTSSSTTAPSVPFWIVDSFATKPFRGNPAAVVVTSAPLSEATMMNITLEMNQSETAFVVLLGDQGKGETISPSLRWFTSEGEIDLCGHATLASAHVLFNEVASSVAFHTIKFQTKFVGELVVSRSPNDNGFYVMEFPSRRGTQVNPSEVTTCVWQGLFSSSPPDCVVEVEKARDLMIVLKSEEDVRRVEPNYGILKEFKEYIIITAPASLEGRREEGDGATRATPPDFVSRFFCPNDVVPEDPVTGSAHCTLAPYWGEKLGKTQLVGEQLSRRGGIVRCVNRCGDGDDATVQISGPATTFASGSMHI